MSEPVVVETTAGGPVTVQAGEPATVTVTPETAPPGLELQTGGRVGPMGPSGAQGDAATIAIGAVTTGAEGSEAVVTNVGTSGDAILEFSIPRGATGAQGPQGDAATIAIGTVTTGQPGSNASVTNVGTATDAVFNLTIPRGDVGPQGDPGVQGPAGSAATVAVGTVTTGAPGSQATVTNSGTAQAAVFDITIPRGDAGAQGAAGASATVSVGTVSTGAAGSSASVTNSGTAQAAVFNFTIPRGDVGAQGPAGQGVPTGGSSGQILAKSSGADYAAQWIDAPAGSLAGLTDVQLGTPSDGQALVYSSSSSKWVPGTVAAGSGGGSGGLNATSTLLDSIASQFNGSTSTFSLLSGGTAFTPANAYALEVLLGGIQQVPTVDYTVSGSTITFTDVPAAGLPCHIIGTTYAAAGGGGVTIAANQSDSTVSLLLHMDGTNGSTTFVDSGYYGLPISANGSAQITTAQSKFGTASGQFTSSGSFLSTTGVPQLSDFTIECWVKLSPSSTRFDSVLCAFDSGFTTTGNWSLRSRFLDTNQLTFTVKTSSGYNDIQSGVNIADNNWHHIAAARSGSTLRLFVDGSIVATATEGTAINTTSPFCIGGPSSANTSEGFCNGYIDEVRVSSTCQYTANFTPPTTAFSDAKAAVLQQDPNFFNNSLLLHFDGTDGSSSFTDSSNNGLAVTASGSATLSATSPKFGTASLSLGSGSYLSVASNSAISLLNDYTIELWYRSTATGPQTLLDRRVYNSFAAGNYTLFLSESVAGGLSFYAASYSTASPIVAYTGINTLDGNWHHVAVTRSGSTTRLFLDGNLVNSQTAAYTEVSNTNPLLIGARYAATMFPFTGNIDELRITRGVARYTSNFTPQTAAFPDNSVPLPAPAVTGQLFSDGTYLYVCLAGGNPGTWKKALLS